MISLNSFKLESEELILQELAAIERVVRSGWYILGPEVEEFEKQWATYCGTNYSIGVANGMDAIEIGLKALNIGVGDEVVTTSMTAFATILAILRTGATPVLADIDPATALLRPESVKRCISNRTKAVLLVHLYGHVKQMDVWSRLCQENGIYLLEDCAQAHGSTWNTQKAGSIGDFGAYSFYPTKNLGALGDAGAIITNNKQILEQSKRLRNYGQSMRYHHPEVGLNSRLDEMHAAVLSVRLEWLDRFLKRRKQIAHQYIRRINNPQITLLDSPEKSENHVYHLFVILAENRDCLASYLHQLGVNTLIHYPIPIHHQKSCQDIKIDPEGLSNSEAHSLNCLSIPCHPQMTDDDVNLVIKAINEYC
jgi:dTDP-4-amino-4,6-dideoxygalactose transaminase